MKYMLTNGTLKNAAVVQSGMKNNLVDCPAIKASFRMPIRAGFSEIDFVTIKSKPSHFGPLRKIYSWLMIPF